MLSKKVFFLFLILSVFLISSPGFAATVIDYTYDDLNRLETMVRDDGPQFTYDHDEVGNITDRDSDNPDTDGDHINDVDEVNLYGTDRYSSADNDTDGMPDDWEYVYGVNDPIGDYDSDGINNASEFLYYTDPDTNDTDGDTVSDRDEALMRRYGDPNADPRDSDFTPDPTELQTALDVYNSLQSCTEASVRIVGDATRYYSVQAAYDAAPDGATILVHALTFYENFTADYSKTVTIEGGYNCDFTSRPVKTTIKTMNGVGRIILGSVRMRNFIARNSTDTDSDGTPDEWEIVFGVNPLLNDINSDNDGDGLSNGDEFFLYGTDPGKIDTDGDGVDDKTEIDSGSDPLDPASVPACVADGDLAPLGAPDGVVDVADALVAFRMASGVVTPTAAQICSGDVAPVGNPDGVIDISDALVIMRKAMGLQ